MMSEQLVIYLDHYDSDYSWCLTHEDGSQSERQRGDTQALAESLGAGNHQALLILGGPQVAMRQLAYSEQEKKHLKRLMPFQLEEAVIGDISQFHFALGQPKDGQVALAYTEKSRLQALFTELAKANIEITRCVPAALLLPLPADENGQPQGWALHKIGSEVLVRHGQGTGFTVDQKNLAQTLSLLLTAENRVDQLPELALSAASETDLAELRAALPTALEGASTRQQVSDIHLLSPANDTINLCQGEFSQRLPVERWWRAGRGLIIGAGVALVVYIGTLVLGIYQLQQDNLDTRRAIEQVFRTVVPTGPANDPERRLSIMLRDLQPDVGGSAAVPLLAQVLPQIPDTVTVRGIHYTANNDELSLNLQASTFNAIETLRSEIANGGLGAELLSASAQGN
ncbi:MAG TPA: type II secretion system protein GspL, partial [Cellvibrionaceae bacterium]